MNFIKNRHLALAFGALAFTLVGCATEAESESEDNDDIGIVTQRLASAADIAHACEHAQVPEPGPGYSAVTASATASISSPLQQEHAHFNLTLPGAQGFVKFTAEFSREYGIYTDPALTPEGPSKGICVKLSNAAGTGTVANCLVPAFVTAISAATCPAIAGSALPTFGTTANALSYVRTYDLVAGKTYFVQFRRNDSTNLYANFEDLSEQ